MSPASGERKEPVAKLAANLRRDAFQFFFEKMWIAAKFSVTSDGATSQENASFPREADGLCQVKFKPLSLFSTLLFKRTRAFVLSLPSW